MRRFPVVIVAMMSSITSIASANSSLSKCTSQIEKIDQADFSSIVIAKAKSVETGTKDGRYVMRVRYTVTEVLFGAKNAEVVVETVCNPAPVKPTDDRADRAGRCDARDDAMP